MMEHLMKKLLLLLLLFSTGYGQQFNGTVFDLDTGRTQVISIRQSEDDYVANLNKQTLENYRRMNAEMEISLANMRQEDELRKQTAELKKQIELLRRITGQ